ncbi:glycosyltransferase involved in cell wall biosynthesis [Pseudarthrobacter defluvii]|uniref:glycosyltransferase n=1 Tax=Pseudarthrobacter defluvii TaxID=410837 RepID=UPI0027838DB6|nr:glycosyltransferase [Pseudarthrobacter defluvii]MDQ0768072.1 glycosyltransferase involved in cell wall biosynthesis [Pseudarthrobacter defluvii]
MLYGNSLGYPAQKPGDGFHIFIGGSSDRDPQAIRALEEEVLSSPTPVQLDIATGGPASEIRRGGNVVRHPGYVSQKEFGELLSTASVVFLPLARGTRAAGHMVLVGAVESGIPVAVTPNEGMKEYVIEPGVVLCDPDRAILPQLRELADATRGRQSEIRALWKAQLSLDSYISRIMEVLEPVRV